MRRAVLTLVSAFLSSSVLKANHTTLLGVRLFFSRWNQQQKVLTNLWISVCLICCTGTLKRLFNDFHFVIHEAHFSRKLLVVCVCVFISVHRKGFFWLNRTMDVLPDIQASDVMLRKLLCVKNLRLHVIDNHSRDLLASNCARVSIKPGRAARSKRQLLKLSKTNSKSA